MLRACSCRSSRTESFSSYCSLDCRACHHPQMLNHATHAHRPSMMHTGPPCMTASRGSQDGTATAQQWSTEQLDSWSRAITATIRHTGSESHCSRHGHIHHPSPRSDGAPVGAPMSLATLEQHLHHPIPKEAIMQIVQKEPRLRWIFIKQKNGWVPPESWKISASHSRSHDRTSCLLQSAGHELPAMDVHTTRMRI